MTPEEIIAKVLEGFDKGVFVRDVSRDSDSHWAVRALPYLVALSKLAELPAALAASEQRGKKLDEELDEASKLAAKWAVNMVNLRAQLQASERALALADSALLQAVPQIFMMPDPLNGWHKHNAVALQGARDRAALASPGSPQEKGKTE